MNRDEVRFITLDYYNQLGNTTYTDIKALMYNPPLFSQEMLIRTMLCPTPYDLSVILVVAEIPDKKIEIHCQSKTYSDVKEVLYKLS